MMYKIGCVFVLICYLCMFSLPLTGPGGLITDMHMRMAIWILAPGGLVIPYCALRYDVFNDGRM